MPKNRLNSGIAIFSYDRQPFTPADLETRFDIITEDTFAFRANPETVRLVAEAYRIQHAYLFNKLWFNRNTGGTPIYEDDVE